MRMSRRSTRVTTTSHPAQMDDDALRHIRFSVNLSMLFLDVPFLERFEAARACGFDVVEFWWPGAAQLADTAQAIRDAGLEVALFNFDGGDFVRGDRGLAGHPRRVAEFRACIEPALEFADSVGCRRINALAGKRDDEFESDVQDDVLRGNVRWAADAAAGHGVDVMIEPLNTAENGACLIPTAAAASDLIGAVARPNVRLQHDVYHSHRMGEDPKAVFDQHRETIGHIQIADDPGRGAPGTGNIDFSTVFHAVAASPYNGFVGLEYSAPAGDTETSFAWLPYELRGSRA